jgi:hypothetical protein
MPIIIILFQEITIWFEGIESVSVKNIIFTEHTKPHARIKLCRGTTTRQKVAAQKEQSPLRMVSFSDRNM